jgi:hypothetical protein
MYKGEQLTRINALVLVLPGEYEISCIAAGTIGPF